MNKLGWIWLFLLFIANCSSQKSPEVESVSGATIAVLKTEETKIPILEPENMGTKAIIFLYSSPQGNTRKIAEAIATKINAPIFDIDIMDLENIDFTGLDEYQIMGFGSGIDSGRHFQQMLDFANTLPFVQNKRAFIFSTSGIFNETKMFKDHEAIRNILQQKGFTIIEEFGCLGHNTNSFLKFFGGMNKGRPNAEDIKNAEAFAEKLIE